MKLTPKQLANVAAGSAFMTDFKLMLWTNAEDTKLVDLSDNLMNLLPDEKTLDEIAIKLFNRHFKHTVKVSVFKRKKQ